MEGPMAEITRRIKFTRDYEVKDHRAGTARAEAYKAGAGKTLPERSAAHFVARGVADYDDVNAAKPKRPAEPEPEPEPEPDPDDPADLDAAG
jgi:hypothetical protein